MQTSPTHSSDPCGCVYPTNICAIHEEVAMGHMLTAAADRAEFR